MNRKLINYFILGIALVILVACRASVREELQSVTLVVTNGVLIDGTGTHPITDGFVAIDGNRIVAVGQSTDFEIPENTLVIDAAGGTILPGVINAHVHQSHSVATRRELFLLEGVTSVCDLASSLPQMQDFAQEKSDSGPAARGFKAGPIVTAPGGYPGPYHGFSLNYEIQGEEEAELAVRDLHTQGADYIKVALEPGLADNPLPMISLQELRSVVATAHSLGLLVRAHLEISAMLDLALEAGVDVLEHVPMPSYTHEELQPMFDDAGNFHMPPELETQMLRLIDQGVVLVPTLDVYIGEIYRSEDLEPEDETFIQSMLGVVRFFYDSGGIIAVGNDYGNPGVLPGMPLGEMELLQAVGLSPLEVIEAATKRAAFVCGHSDELGTLEVGKLADLIIVAGNPLDDLNAMSSIVYIVKDGELVLSPQQDSD